MPLYTADALVLRTYKLRDADRIVVFLTADRGKKRGVAYGARKSRSRFSGALEPLTRVSVGYVEREARDLVSLNFADAVQSPMSALDPGALGHVGYFADLIDAWAAENDANEKLFRLGAALLAALAAGAPIDPLARYFEYWLLRLEGVYPVWVRCARCGTALESAGGALLREAMAFTCGACAPRAGSERVSAEAFRFLRAASGVAPDRMAVGEAPPPQAMRELERAHRAMIATFLDREPRSSRVLREMGA